MSVIPTREQLIAFLNAMPTTLDASQWLMEFRLGLRHLFPEIDHVVFFYNMLDEKHRDSSLNWANLKLTADETSSLGFAAEAVSTELHERIESIIDLELAAIERPRSFYHIPTVHTYYDGGWLGAIILFREHSKSPFSDEMLSSFSELEPFFRFAFKDHSLRYHLAHPADSIFYDAVLKITEQLSLTHQEMRILMFRLLGSSYKEIGDMLDVSASTVKNHLNSIHRKAGVHTQSELFARYFAPTFGLFTRLAGEADRDS